MSPVYEPGPEFTPWYRRQLGGPGGLRPLGLLLAALAGLALVGGGSLLDWVLDGLVHWP